MKDSKKQYMHDVATAYQHAIDELNLKELPLNVVVVDAAGRRAGGEQHGETIRLFDNVPSAAIDHVLRHELTHWMLGRHFVFGGAHDRYFFAADAAMHGGWQAYVSRGAANNDAAQPGAQRAELRLAKEIFDKTQCGSVENQIKQIAKLSINAQSDTLKAKIECGLAWAAGIILISYIASIQSGVI